MDEMIRTYRPGEPSFVSYLQMTLYEKQYGFRPIFEYYLTAGMADFLRDPAGSQLWVADQNGQIAGSIAIVKSGQDEAHLRWFAVKESLQGHGIGSRLIDTAMSFCREQGYTHVILWTVDILKAARHLYGRHCFVLTETKENREWTDHVLLEERWDYHS